jgi:hypothetical protein
MALTATDAPVWTGILRQLQYALARSPAETEATVAASHHHDQGQNPDKL